VNVINLARKFAGILSTLTLLTVGSIVLIREMSLDFDTVLYALKLALLGGIVAGFLGYSIGKIFETPRRKTDKSMKQNKNSDLLIDDILIGDLNNFNDVDL